MLTNLGKMPLDKVHSMLRMFAIQGAGGKECSQVSTAGGGLLVVWLYIVFICCVLQAELKAFLDRKVREQHLSFAGGQYQLSKQ